MLTIILVYLAVSIVSFCFISFLVKSAPFGWEDEYEFHLKLKKPIKVTPPKLSNLGKSYRNFSKTA